MTIKQPIYFTTPRFSNAQGNLTTGEGANLTAQAVAATTNFLFAAQLATGMSELQVKALFMTTLNGYMKNGAVKGGSASLYPPNGVTLGMVPVIDYKTTAIGSDNCR